MRPSSRPRWSASSSPSCRAAPPPPGACLVRAVAGNRDACTHAGVIGHAYGHFVLFLLLVFAEAEDRQRRRVPMMLACLRCRTDVDRVDVRAVVLVADAADARAVERD